MTDPTTLPNVSIAGLSIPAALAAQIITALRDTYPTLTAGLIDDDAVRAVLMQWISGTLADYQARQALAPLDGEIEVIRATYNERATAARTSVGRLMKLITPTGS